MAVVENGWMVVGAGLVMYSRIQTPNGISNQSKKHNPSRKFFQSTFIASLKRRPSCGTLIK